jgi:PAS domain S-box-containing protein
MPPIYTAWTLRKTLRSLVLCAIGPALAVILAYGAAEYVRLGQSAKDQSLALARVLAHDQAEMVRHTRLLLDALARLPAVRRLDAAEVEPVLTQMLRDHPLYSTLFLLDASGRISATARAALRGEDMSHRKYYRDVVRTKAFSAGEYAVSRTTGSPAFHFASPILDDAGELVGVIGAGLRLDSLDPAVTGPIFPQGTRFVLYDHRGLRLHRFPTPDGDWFQVGSAGPPQVIGPVLHAREDTGQFDALGGGGNVLSFGFVRLRLSDTDAPYMSILVGIPRPTVASLLLAGPGVALVLLLAALGLALAIARVLGERALGRGLDQVVAATESLAVGDLSRRAGRVEACAEVAELGLAFDRMADQLEMRERQRAESEAELRASEEKYRRVVEASLEGIWILDADHRTIYANQVLASTLGTTPEDMLGRPMAEFIFPEDRTDHEARLDARRAGRDEVYERRLRPLAGGEIWAVVSARAVLAEDGTYAGSFVMLTDETEKKARLDHLKLLTQVVENALNGFSILDAEGRFVYVNRAFLTMWGLGSAVQLLGEPLSLCCPDPALARRIVELARDTGNAREEFTAQRPDGSSFDVRLDAFSHQDSKGNLFFPLSSWDVTQIKAHGRAMTAAKEAAESANRAKSEFLAAMSHEIRTPLNGVLGMLQLLRTTLRNEEQSEYVETAMQSARSLLNILADILDLSRIEAGAMTMLDEPFALDDVVDSVSEILGLEARNRGLALTVEVEPELPPLRGDAGRIRQILFNLVGNSLKYTDQGSIRLEVYRLPLCPTPDRLCLHLAVIDTGIGIPAEKLDQVFGAFSQAEGALKRRYGGVGLGLAIVKRLVLMMGGNITVDSEPGQGTEMHVTLPLALAHLEELEAVRPPAPVPEPTRARPGRKAKAGAKGQAVSPLEGCRVLVVEDERINRFSMGRMLTKMGMVCEMAENGRQALEMLARERYDCVLMDIQMPVMDGLSAVVRIREGQDGVLDPGVPVVALTAFAMAGDRERFLAQGMNAYLPKPLDLDELKQVLTGLLARR